MLVVYYAGVLLAGGQQGNHLAAPRGRDWRQASSEESADDDDYTARTVRSFAAALCLCVAYTESASVLLGCHDGSDEPDIPPFRY